MRKAKIFVLSLVLFLTSIVFLKYLSTPTDPLQESITYSEEVQKLNHFVAAAPLPAKIDFAGEPVPLEHFDVRERLERELLVNVYWHSSTLLAIKRANRFLPRISEILANHGIPDDFKYIPVIESNLTNAVSPAKAVGFWQLLEGTAKEFGLEVNKEIDERYHWEKSTEAACRYLKWLHQRLGNWTLVAAAYNGGTTSINRFISIQKNNDFYNLLLAEETERYIFRILAMKLILSNPEMYGFSVSYSDLYPPISTEKIVISHSISDLASWSLERGFSYRELKYFNPWLRNNQLNLKANQTYIIELPKQNYRKIYRHLIP